MEGSRERVRSGAEGRRIFGFRCGKMAGGGGEQCGPESRMTAWEQPSKEKSTDDVAAPGR